MSITLETIIGKTVLVGLSYFDKGGELLQQRQMCGTVIEADKEKGIALQVIKATETQSKESDSENKPNDAHFVLPSSLTCWFNAPAGHYKNPADGIDIENPNFLVTWDIHQKQKEIVEDGDHQWWEWVPNTVAPQVGN